MKYKIILLFVLALLIPSLASAQETKKDDMATVPNWTWVNVKNLEPVKGGNNSFGYGRLCGIKRGGTVTVVGINEDHFLVRYFISGIQFGSSCPKGILYFIPKETFSKLSEEYRQVSAAEQNEKDLVKRLIEN